MLSFVMTDGRGIKGTSEGFVRGDLRPQNSFLSLSLASGSASEIAVRAAMAARLAQQGP